MEFEYMNMQRGFFKNIHLNKGKIFKDRFIYENYLVLNLMLFIYLSHLFN